MRALLDVNLLIALLDTGHVHHRIATDWLGAHIEEGWASCPITQNGCLRILSLESYPRRQPVAAVAARLREATLTRWHTFWPDDSSLLDETSFDTDRLLGSRQITDAYLLGLAARHDARFVTFDQGIDLRSVHGAADPHLLIL